MLSLAEIRFVNPYSSITSSGFKPTPALLRYDSNNNKLIFDSSA